MAGCRREEPARVGVWGLTSLSGFLGVWALRSLYYGILPFRSEGLLRPRDSDFGGFGPATTTARWWPGDLGGLAASSERMGFDFFWGAFRVFGYMQLRVLECEG